MMEITEVKDEAQAEKAAALAGIIWREHYAGILSDEQIGYMLDAFQSREAIVKQMREGYRYFLVRDDGSPIGYFAIRPNGGDMFLSKLYLLRYARGRGIGRSCVRFVEEKALDERCGTISLTVNKRNADSVAAYRAFGFETTGEGVTNIGGGYVMDDYYMTKRLTTPKN